MPDRLDLDFDGERTEGAPPARRPTIAHPDDERFADPDVEEALDEANRVPSDELEVPLEDDGGDDRIEDWRDV